MTLSALELAGHALFLLAVTCGLVFALMPKQRG
jgi:hypothetical protein